MCMRNPYVFAAGPQNSLHVRMRALFSIRSDYTKDIVMHLTWQTCQCGVLAGAVGTLKVCPAQSFKVPVQADGRLHKLLSHYKSL
jgi:hypothetical protein